MKIIDSTAKQVASLILLSGVMGLWGNDIALTSSTEFCGWSTRGNCSSDSDCVSGGCSGQVCQSKKEPPVITTCEWRDCYDKKKYDVNCKCIENKCQWAK